MYICNSLKQQQHNATLHKRIFLTILIWDYKMLDKMNFKQFYFLLYFLQAFVTCFLILLLFFLLSLSLLTHIHTDCYTAQYSSSCSCLFDHTCTHTHRTIVARFILHVLIFSVHNTPCNTRTS